MQNSSHIATSGMSDHSGAWAYLSSPRLPLVKKGCPLGSMAGSTGLVLLVDVSLDAIEGDKTKRKGSAWGLRQGFPEKHSQEHVCECRKEFILRDQQM